ncbi:hypothetical protein GGR56DRAFT_686513 [Xylariaceae sp. FL0804]|nr:hypothetical protein GGR56DRAFT_686513 [Xylariaceae sp. FL0804]
MSFSNPRRTAVARPDPDCGNGLKLKTSLALRKGATFHSPITPPSSPPSGTAGFRVPSLPRRSQTNLDDYVVGASVRRAALTIGNIEDSLTASDVEPSSSSRRTFRDDSLPIPRGFLDHMVTDDAMAGDSSTKEPLPTETERRVLRPRTRRSSRHHVSDSGLGTSITATTEKRGPAKSPGPVSAITRSANASKTESVRGLSNHAQNRIYEHTLKPLLAKPSLKEFRPIVFDCPRRIRENQIVCLRDLEKTLIFMAPVSQLRKDPGVWGVTYRSFCVKERARSAKLYLDFCLTSIRCIQATVEYLSDRQQTRPSDRPYSNGYFIDLVEQIRHHAQQMQDARERQASGEELGDMDVDPTDEVKLMGGLATHGRPAELVRVKKNGKAISIATGKPFEEDDSKAQLSIKRSMSEQAEDEEDIMRSMARRKKNAPPEEYAPKPCPHPGCNKQFKRPCDLTKHEKTHSRPWKCPIPTCKFHEYGWPTEKEMGRHVNDKHSSAPAMYECHFKPCPYKSKRESNCKQHMEKAHGWEYNRTKAPKRDGKATSSAQPTPQITNLPTPSSENTDVVMTPPEDAMFTAYNDITLPAYPTSEEFNADLYDQQPPFDGAIQLDFSPIENGTPSTDAGQTDAGQFSNYQELSPEFTSQFEDIYGAHVRLPALSHAVFDNKIAPDTVFPNVTTSTCHQVSTHISPAGHGNTMLYTPTSMADDNFEEYQSTGNSQLTGDFLLYPSSNMEKGMEMDASLFGNVPPSVAAGFTQPSSQDFNLDYNAHMDWAFPDSQGFSSH